MDLLARLKVGGRVSERRRLTGNLLGRLTVPFGCWAILFLMANVLEYIIGTKCTAIIVLVGLSLVANFYLNWKTDEFIKKHGGLMNIAVRVKKKIPMPDAADIAEDSMVLKHWDGGTTKMTGNVTCPICATNFSFSGDTGKDEPQDKHGPAGGSRPGGKENPS